MLSSYTRSVDCAGRYDKGVDLKTIVVLWMDDRRETYADVQTQVLNGALHISQYKATTRGRLNEWHLPLSNIRIWYPADQEPPRWLAEDLG